MEWLLWLQCCGGGGECGADGFRALAIETHTLTAGSHARAVESHALTAGSHALTIGWISCISLLPPYG